VTAKRSLTFAIISAGILVGATACHIRPWPRRAQSRPALSDTLPSIPVYEIAPGPDSSRMVIQPARGRDPLAQVASTKRVTLATSNADARTLLLWLAQQGGVSLVVSEDVRARISVNFSDIPVVEAMRAVISEAGLSVMVADALSPWPPVVFYHLLVNVNEASAATIAARFGVSAEMAKWIVDSRVKP
jgi:hypothetical protein